MRCGISTACFYPAPTLQAFEALAAHAVPVTEIFLNTFSEMEDGYVQKLRQVQQQSGIEVSSIHPCTTMIEGYLFAANYPTRLEDGLTMYRRYFEICNELGADKLVFHGDHSFNRRFFSDGDYAENFRRLARCGREYGVAVCHENVAYCRLSRPKYVRALRPLLAEDAAFVLDTKQVRRRDGSLQKMMDAMDGAIRQVHISDYDAAHNCLLPGRGDMDIPAFLQHLAAQGFTGDLIIEVYNDNFDDVSELVQAMGLIDHWLRVLAQKSSGA